MSSWNDMVIEQFRAGQEVIADRFERSVLVLLHTTGARSGEPRIHPLAQLPIDGETVIVASAGGRPEHPAWFFNLKANPDATIERWGEDAIESVDVRAEIPEGDERDELWAKVVAVAPAFGEYQTQVERRIPVVRLLPR